jgi:murein L,D-transpeptidase YcbB/YkuD
MIKNISKYIVLIVIISSCSNKKVLDINIIKENINAKIKLQQDLTNTEVAKIIDNNSLIFKDTIYFPTYLKTLYDSTTIVSLWTDGYKPKAIAKTFLNTLKKAYYYGLDSNYFNINLLSSLYDSATVKNKNTEVLASLDVMLSNELIKFSIYNKYGRLQKVINDSVTLNLAINNITDKESKVIKNGLTANNLSLIFDSLVPKNPFFLPLQHGIKHYFSTHSLSKKKVYVPIMKSDSVKTYSKAREALFTYNYLDSSNYKNDSVFILKLKEFQHQHGLDNDGKIGSATANMLSKSNYERYQLAAVSLERLRMKSYDTSFFFCVNIPSFQLNIIDNNKIDKQSRVIVGTLINRTPTFTAKMQYLILNPYWAIPYSISSKEILPKIKANTNEVEKKGYTITDNNMNIVDPSTVDWSSVTSSNFKYRITQTRSGATALGRVKFIFPNNNSVYLHDTPSRHLFKNDTRSYSHGCIRLENPLNITEYILTKQDTNLTIDSINSIVNSGQQKRFNVNYPIQVHIDYYTSLTDINGTIQFFDDIYGKDELYKNVLFSNK